MYGEMLDAIGATEWEGDDATVTCPDGCTIEPDAESCPCGYRNPLVSERLI